MAKIIIGILCIILSIFFIVLQISNYVNIWYQYEREIYSYWTLADKSSTIKEKSEYITLFLNALKQNKFAEYNALFFKTPDNSFKKNLQALESLKIRLEKIQTMNENDLAYQMAIQQITQQEQGEAHAMLSIFWGCYKQIKNIFIWDWIGSIVIFFEIVLFICGCILWCIGADEC